MDWPMLLTYIEVLQKKNGVPDPVDGAATLRSLAQQQSQQDQKLGELEKRLGG